MKRMVSKNELLTEEDVTNNWVEGLRNDDLELYLHEHNIKLKLNNPSDPDMHFGPVNFKIITADSDFDRAITTYADLINLLRNTYGGNRCSVSGFGIYTEDSADIEEYHFQVYDKIY